MDGPIQSMFRSMADRRRSGRGVLPTILRLGFQPSVTYQEGMEAVQDYVPDELKREGPYSPRWNKKEAQPQSAFASLSGNRTARQDLKGMKYPASVIGDEDGYTQPTVQGGVNDLPEPEEVYASPDHRDYADAQKRYKQITDEMMKQGVSPNPNDKQIAALATAAALANQQMAVATTRINSAQAKSEDPLGKAMTLLEAQRDRAIQTGNLPLYQNLSASLLGPHLKGDDGLPFAPEEYAKIGRQTAMGPAMDHARQTMQTYNGLKDAPPASALAVKRNIAYLYPWQAKNPADPRERQQYINTLTQALYNNMAVGDDPTVWEYSNALAWEVAYLQHPWETKKQR